MWAGKEGIRGQQIFNVVQKIYQLKISPENVRFQQGVDSVDV